jgi:hypothetical protein
MAEWLKRVLEEADRQFEQLPEWKKAGSEQFLSAATEKRKNGTV